MSLAFILIFGLQSLHALELDSSSFYFCSKKTATHLESRSLRVHEFPKEGKCVVLYSVEGRDQVVAKGSWLSFCKNKAERMIKSMEKGLWTCKAQEELVQVFYSL